jgi:CDP-diacylglycerol--serine O-phosphatidyltransferase
MFQRTPSPRPRRLRSLSFNRLIPNILTTAALCAGLTSIRYGLSGNWQNAVGAILLAGVLDGLDGRIARLLRGSTKFGAELDSLADFVSFGVAPAMLLFFWSMQRAGGAGWALVLLYAVCCALRLARFNTMMAGPEIPPGVSSFFVGVPSPAAACVVLLPLMISFQWDGGGMLSSPIVNAVALVAVSFLMVSRVPTFSGKRVRIPQHYVLPLLLVVGVLAGLLVAAPWATLATLTTLYIVSIPFSLRAYRRWLRHGPDGGAAAIPGVIGSGSTDH